MRKFFVFQFRLVMEEHGWTRNHNLQEIFSEMKSLKQVSIEGKRKKLVIFCLCLLIAPSLYSTFRPRFGRSLTMK